MALDNAPQLGGSFLNLKELVADGPQLVGFRIQKFLPAEAAQGFAGQNVPVIADAVILSGPRTGELWPGQKFIGAITAALRGVKNPNIQKGIGVAAPVFPEGHEMLVRVRLYGSGHNAASVGDPASPAELRDANATYDKLGGKELWSRQDLVAVVQEPVGAGVGAAAAESNGIAQPLGQQPGWAADSGRPAWG